MDNNISAAIASLPISTSQLEQLANQTPLTGQVSINGDFGSKEIAFSERQAAVNSTASEFEATFLSMMLKEMRNTLDQGEGGLFGGEGSDSYGGMFDMFMGQHMAEANPLGIGNAVERYMQNKISS